MNYLIEHDYFIDSNGVVYPLTTASLNRDVLSDEGSGLPPIDYITERGPFQHGDSVRDYFLRPRVLQYLIRQKFCSRQEWWDGRSALLEAIRPNKDGGPIGVLRKILPNGAKRDISVTPVEGPRFEPRKLNEWDEWSIQEVLRFLAHNPIYFDPVVHVETWERPAVTGFPYTFTFPFSVPAELQFPVTFPIEFYDFDVSDVIAYAGNWEEYPTFVITGPAEYIEIRNDTTNEKIAVVGYTLSPSRTLTIDLTYSVKTITLDDGTSLERYLTADSDIGTFHLKPGNNSIIIIVRGSGQNSQVEMTWKDRYIGI